MLGVFVTILTVILVFVSLLMSLVILMQRPKQEGLGAAFGGGLTDQILGSGTTDFLKRATVFMGVTFFVLSLTIATLMAYDRSAERDSQSEAVLRAAANELPDADATGTPPPVESSSDPLGTPSDFESLLGAPPIPDGEPAPEVDGPSAAEIPADAPGDPSPGDDEQSAADESNANDEDAAAEIEDPDGPSTPQN